jgi:hypothetical protein
MKYFLTIILTSLICYGALSQELPISRCPYKGVQVPATRAGDTVGDFTIRTTDGVSRNLYSTLDSGKTVFIDLFYTTCVWCQYFAPVIEEVYQNHGAGQGGIEFWGISNNLQDPDSIIDQYRQDFNVTNPCAGPHGGGTTAHTTVIAGQNFQGWPTYCIVCPDHTMFFDPCYPPVVTGFDPFFEICASMVGTHEMKPDPPLSVYPNPANGIIFIEIPSGSNGKIQVELINILGSCILSSSYTISPGTPSLSLDVTSLPSGAYLLRIWADNKLLDNKKISISR